MLVLLTVKSLLFVYMFINASVFSVDVFLLRCCVVIFLADVVIFVVGCYTYDPKFLFLECTKIVFVIDIIG